MPTETTTAYLSFPIDIAYGSKAGPETKTTVFEATSGHETRNILWDAPRIRFDVATGITTDAELQKLIALFRNVSGRAYPFRIRDWSDYKIENQTIGTGDGTTTDFQLIKDYATGTSKQTRTIKAYYPGSIGDVTVGGVADPNFNLDVDTGILSFATPPASGADVVVTYAEFDVIARFDTDNLSIDLQAYKLGAASVPVIEVYE